MRCSMLTAALSAVAALGACRTATADGFDLPFVVCTSTRVPPTVDGKLTDACWRGAIELTPFTRQAAGDLPKAATRAYLLHDKTHLYVGVACDEPLLDARLQRTHEIKAEAKARDGDVWADDAVEIFIQPKRSAGSYHHLSVNTIGTLYDARCSGGAFDKAWNSAARVGVSHGETAWTVELAVPLSSLGVAGAPADTWGLNICRHRVAMRENSCWSPVRAGFHEPTAFGSVRFVGASPGMRGVLLPRLNEGRQRLSATIGNPSDSPRDVTLTVLTRYERGDWGASSQSVTAPARGQASGRVDAVLRRANAAFHLHATDASERKTQCLRTGRLAIRPDTEYRFSAMVRAEKLAKGRRPVAVSASVYDGAGACLLKYHTVLPIPTGTYGWRHVEARWRSPAKAAGVLVWLVKWGGVKVTGDLWVDDIRMVATDTGLDVVPNSGLEKDDYGAVTGWPVRLPIVPSYDRGSSASVAFRLNDADGRLLYASAPVVGSLGKRVTEIASGLALTAAIGADGIHRVRELVVNQGAYLALPVVLRSSKREKLDGCRLVLDAPEFLTLVDPAPRAVLLERKPITRDGRPYTRHVLGFGRDRISPAEPTKASTRIHRLLLRCGAAPADAAEWRVFHHAEAGAVREPDNEAPLTVLPALAGRRPERVLIKHWACSSFYRPLRRLNAAERAAVVDTWALAGFNAAGTVLGEAAAARCGFALRQGIPLITAPGHNFHGGGEYLDAHPEARAVAFSGRVYANAFCPTYFLSDANKHLADVRRWLAGKARRVAIMDWDYEVPVTKPGSLCVCDRCRAAFAKHAGLLASATLTAETILAKHRKAWVDFRCRQNARLAELFRKAIKAANPKCMFTVYSGYQGATDERYGVDWRYMAKPADLVWCGYGRPVKGIADTHNAIDGRPFICGELAWYGNYPYDNTVARTRLFRRLTDGGSGIMAYFNWIVDGRFYAAVSDVAALVADFEPFFAWAVDAAGQHRTLWRRDDGLVKAGGQGTAADTAVLTRGAERLVFLFNEQPKARTFQIEMPGLAPEMVCVDYERKQVLTGKLTLAVGPKDVRVLHVTSRKADRTVGRPDGLRVQQEAGRRPILRWRARGDQPGDQAFAVEVSRDRSFASGDVLWSARVTRPVAVVGRDLDVGIGYVWRVRGVDAVSGAKGPWSEPHAVTVPLVAWRQGRPGSFNPERGRFRVDGLLNAPVDWRLSILDAKGRPVRVFEANGRHVAVEWDGRDASGAVAPPGAYRYELACAAHPGLGVVGGVAVDPLVGKANPTLAICRGFVLTVPEGDVALEHDYAVSRTKTYSLRLTARAPRSRAYYSNYTSGGIGETRLAVTPGKTYRLSGFVKTDLKQGEAHLTLTFFTNDGRWAGVPGKKASGEPTEPVVGTSDWTRREITLTAPKGAWSAVPMLVVRDAHGVCWFDDLALTAVK